MTVSGDQDARDEVKVLEYNAKEGVRAVAFAWFFRRIALPLMVIFALIIISAFVVNGALAGVLSALVFFGPMALLFWFTTHQGQKVLEYWKK